MVPADAAQAPYAGVVRNLRAFLQLSAGRRGVLECGPGSLIDASIGSASSAEKP
jgi:hypothetical protein